MQQLAAKVQLHRCKKAMPLLSLEKRNNLGQLRIASLDCPDSLLAILCDSWLLAGLQELAVAVESNQPNTMLREAFGLLPPLCLAVLIGRMTSQECFL